MHFVSASCNGEKCTLCGEDATHKVGEYYFHDSPVGVYLQHELTAYICCIHFSKLMRINCK